MSKRKSYNQLRFDTNLDLEEDKEMAKVIDKEVSVEDKIVAEPMQLELPHVKHVVLGINRLNMPVNPEGSMSAYDAEAILEMQYEKGYKLFHVEVIGGAPEFIQLLYVFVRE